MKIDLGHITGLAIVLVKLITIKILFVEILCFSNFFLFTHSKALTSRIMTNKLISSDNFQEIIRGGGGY